MRRLYGWSRPAIGIPLAAVGLVACVAGPAMAASAVEPDGESRWRWLILAAAVLALVGSAIWADRKDPEDLTHGGGVEPLAFLVLIAGALGAAYYVVTAFDRGFVSPGTAVSGVGALLVGLGIALNPFPWDLQDLRTSPRTSVVVAVVAALVVGASGQIGRIGDPTTSYAVPSGSVGTPAKVSRVAWSWTMPGRIGEPPVAIAHGFVTGTTDAVFRVDAATGKPIWRYERRKVQIDDVALTPDHRLVVVDTYVNDGDDYGPTVVLDAETGQERHILGGATGDQLSGHAAFSVSDGDDDHEDGRLSATDLLTGSTWTAEAPERCRFSEDQGAPSAIVITTTCNRDSKRSGEIIGYDDRSGKVLWRQPLPTFNEPVSDDVRVEPVTLDSTCDLVSINTRSQARLLDPRTGVARVTAKPGDYFGDCTDHIVHVAEDGPGNRWIDLRTGASTAGPDDRNGVAARLRDQSLSLDLATDASFADVTPYDRAGRAGAKFQIKLGLGMRSEPRSSSTVVPGAVLVYATGAPATPGSPTTIVGLR